MPVHVSLAQYGDRAVIELTTPFKAALSGTRTAIAYGFLVAFVCVWIVGGVAALDQFIHARQHELWIVSALLRSFGFLALTFWAGATMYFLFHVFRGGHVLNLAPDGAVLEALAFRHARKVRVPLQGIAKGVGCMAWALS